MPVHDWTRVPDGIFHHFHHEWISALQRALNRGLLPEDYYALAEQHAAGFESDRSFSLRKRSPVAVRHVSGDRIVAFIEIVSPGNKSSRAAIRSFVEKASELLLARVNLLVVDLHPPGPRDPHGIHAAIWEEFDGQESQAPPAKPLVLASDESALTVRAYVATLGVGDELAEMPLFLDSPFLVHVPLEATYRAAFEEVPRRWRSTLDRA